MPHDDATLPESVAAELVRAGFSVEKVAHETLLASLSHKHPRARVLGLRGLERQGIITGPLLVAALNDADVEVVREALNLAARTCPSDAALDVAIIQSLDSDDALVTEAAVFALGERGVHDALDALKQITSEHDDARCREAGVVALAQIGSDGGREVIVAALADKPTVRRRAVVALSSFEGDDIEAALDRAAEDRDWQVRSAVEQLRRDLD